MTPYQLNSNERKTILEILNKYAKRTSTIAYTFRIFGLVPFALILLSFVTPNIAMPDITVSSFFGLIWFVIISILLPKLLLNSRKFTLKRMLENYTIHCFKAPIVYAKHRYYYSRSGRHGENYVGIEASFGVVSVEATFDCNGIRKGEDCIVISTNDVINKTSFELAFMIP